MAKKAKTAPQKERDEEEDDEDQDEDGEDDSELEDVEVERMPNLDGWEYYKANDVALERERWTLALQPSKKERRIAYAFWPDPKKEPHATGALDVSTDKKAKWAVAVREADAEDGGLLDDRAREEIILTLLERHDDSLEAYEDRLLFSLQPPEEDEDDDDDD